MTYVDVKSHLGAAVRKQRVELRISQEELAYRSGLHRTYISDVERGTRNISLESIEKLAQALDLSVSRLFAQAAEESTPKNVEVIDILLIEDNPLDVELSLRAFKKAGIANILHVAMDGQKALEMLFLSESKPTRKNQPLPGLILLDLDLPKIHGLEVLRQIKADKRTQNIPVIALTISDQDSHIAACQQLGVKSYIVKPIGIGNFTEATPPLPLEWALKRRSTKA
jgi:CheY-like chemotaxis protein/DNA-binding XRE family transcriptional regulator